MSRFHPVDRVIDGARLAKTRALTIVLCLAFIAMLLGVARAQTGRLTVKVDQPGVKISPMLYGLMTEEINHSYDGGLYAELIQNRAFKDNPTRAVHWSLVEESGGAGMMALDDTQPINEALTTCLKLTVTTAGGSQRVGVANNGYWGIPVKPSMHYRCSFYARAGEGFRGPLNVDIESANGAKVQARARVPKITDNWQQYTVNLTTGDVGPSTANRFVISAGGSGVVYLNLISLYPPTYHNRPNGTRPDLMHLLGEMKPAFLRFPGGNYLEGNTIAERFDWKKTVGPVARRAGHQGPWRYRSSDGFGLMEFLEWCDDLKMEPLLCVFAGYALRGDHVAAGPKLEPFVQDALDEIEYLVGSRDTRWGAQRVRDGHPAPFKLTYIEIGNEDGFDRSGSYDGRFAQFFDAIRAKYPKLQLIATAPVRSRVPDVIDDHYYRSARDMERDVHHYDSTDRNGPKIFVGEWASTEGSPTPTLQAALGDAAWLTGLERNSDLVVISCYAPLLVNVNPGARQWGTNLIGYDAMRSFGSPSYYVQKMFAQNRGDVVLPVEVVPQTAVEPPAFTPKGAVGVGTWSTQAEYKDFKVTHDGSELHQPDITTGRRGFQPRGGVWTVADGVLRQASGATDCRAIAGNANWTDYIYHVQARKIAGDEGFLILFHVQDQDNYIWWNIGGWGNTRTALERAINGAKREIGRVVPMTIETGRWYDIRIEVQGRRIRCYLDDKLITEATDGLGLPPDPLYATASRDRATDDVIVKVVNVSPTAQELQMDLQGCSGVTDGSMQVLQGDPGDINTIDEPEKVAPISSPLPGFGRTFRLTFPPHSVTVMRLKCKK
jgi:alpha-L-arabinofuranosidase